MSINLNYYLQLLKTRSDVLREDKEYYLWIDIVDLIFDIAGNIENIKIVKLKIVEMLILKIESTLQGEFLTEDIRIVKAIINHMYLSCTI